MSQKLECKVKMESCDDDIEGKGAQESRDDDSCHADSGLLNMLAEVASATLHNDSLARKTRNPRGRPRKQVTEGRPEPEQETTDANKLSLAQLQLLTEKQLVDLFSLMDSDEIRRTFSYSCHLLQRCQYTASSFGSEMKARQEMQKHLSEHVRDLMRKARESAGFRFTATPVASKTKKIPAVVKETTRLSPVRKPKEKTMKIKLQAPSKKTVPPPPQTAAMAKATRGPLKKTSQPSPQAKSPRQNKANKEEPSPTKKEVPGNKRKRRSVGAFADGEEENMNASLMAGIDVAPEEVTVKEKWLKLYHDKYRAVDEARFRAIQADLSPDSDVEQEYGEVAEEVVVTSEEPTAGSSSNTTSLPDHDYNIYRVNKKTKAVVVNVSEEASGLQDEQMEAVAQSVAAAAQEKEKLKRKRGGQAQSSGIPLHSFMLEETTKQSKVVVKNKPTEPLPCVGSEVVVGYNPNEFYLMKSSELPVIEDLRHQKTVVAEASTAGAQPQFTFVCMNEDGELIEETVEEPSIFLEDDEEQLLEQVAAQASGVRGQVREVPEKDMVDIARKRAKVKPKFVSQSAGERELALQYIGELKQQRGSGADSLHCKICSPVRTFTAPTTLLSHYRSHAGIKPYECRRCGAVFTRQHSLNYHMLIHANLSRFTCPDCHRQFRHPSHYKEHRRRHTGEAPYECSDCMQRFRTRNSYKRHLMTRHGKLLTSTGGLIILPEEEFNKVRCKPRPVRSSRAGDAPTANPSTSVASTSKETSGEIAVKSKPEPKTKGSKVKADPDGTGNFEQQRQEDLIRLLYQRLTSPNEHSSAESSGGESRSGSPVPDDGLVVTTEVHDEQIQVMEVEHHVVVESPEVAAAVVVESIPNSEDQVVEEQCEVVAEETWGSFVHLTVDGQNNVIFLDESQVGAETEAGDGTTTVVIEQPPPPPPQQVKIVSRQRTSTAAKPRATKRAAAVPTVNTGSVSPLATSSTGEVDLLSFVHNAGVMVQHILDIQSDSSTS
ncbi:uncharacterized protein LOC124191035 isoform X2 [Daphnia pulex]|uniref:uncharacterized protein LOC124191035 isoform X2 n=1 Tax=Daphnia pulex TaxID=6669 RepID=UPI001EDFEB8A|nr:uncharacterized protein LOC124191035 isoform X2 [Daphnia pulex]XP_046439944.1 uncharacterized protein LOC124191035 isoform X2 [Daphnia pulex]